MRKDIKKKTIHELAQEHPDKTYRELEKYREADRYEEAQQIPLTEKQKGHELLMELNETKVLLKGNKGIVEEYHRDNMTLKEHLDEAKRTIKNLEIRLAESLEVNESHQKLNGKLQERLTEVEEDNKKLAHQITGKLNDVRKAGL